jgi:ribonuclease HI
MTTTASKLKHVRVVCDGSSLNNQQGKRRAAAAAILEYKGQQKILGEYLGNATNQQAEIVAACIGLEALKGPCRVELISDSEYLILTMKGEYKRKANQEFWDRLDRAAAPHRIEWTWTRGHAGHRLQEKCDKAARWIAQTGKVDQEKLAAILSPKSQI